MSQRHLEKRKERANKSWCVRAAGTVASEALGRGHLEVESRKGGEEVSMGAK